MKKALTTEELQALLPTFDVSLLEKTEVNLTSLNNNLNSGTAATMYCHPCITDEVAATHYCYPCLTDEVAATQFCQPCNPCIVDEVAATHYCQSCLVDEVALESV